MFFNTALHDNVLDNLLGLAIEMCGHSGVNIMGYILSYLCQMHGLWLHSYIHIRTQKCSPFNMVPRAFSEYACLQFRTDSKQY